MTKYLSITRYRWRNKAGESREGALIATRHGKTFFITRAELRDVCDRLHDLADELDTELEGNNNHGY